MNSAAHASTPGKSPSGKLYLVPTPLDHGCKTTAPLTDVLPLRTIETAASLAQWISENAKSTRAFLGRVGRVAPLAHPIQSIAIAQLPRALHKHGDHDRHLPESIRADIRALLEPALQGQDVGLVSEAGMPALADPGPSVVRAAHDLGIAVVPLAGPISIGLALAGSGLNGQNFAFVGYLPRNADARAQRIRELEGRSLRSGQTQLFIETPYRNAALLDALLQTLRDDTWLAVAAGLTLPQAELVSRQVRHWRTAPALRHLDLPAVFGIGR